MFIASIVSFFIGIIFIISYPINKAKNARCTAQTQGTLTEVRGRYNSQGSLKDMHVYTYYVNSIEYRLETLDHSLQVNNIGDTCTIWYDPLRPEYAQAFHGSDKYLLTLLFIGMAMILLGIVLLCTGFIQQFIL
ncbi:DUF3592 domain-containing protein [Oribacterium sp. P6A1]|uniref:DUF3592 domain-containing protein n=1 Tax=Oribacterium sp. P6A1 TaxID=1410612 RepID=UPI00055D7223|nr:DUF3592 domain-containing protein [Oribacterium sp. P6A1]